MSIKTDITRQIVFGDLSENELEDSFRVVQAERNKRKGIVSTRKTDLSEVQRALLTCCVENRNYNISGSADKVICPICGSEHIVKYGFIRVGRDTNARIVASYLAQRMAQLPF